MLNYYLRGNLLDERDGDPCRHEWWIEETAP